jgi:hypothetical protein
MSSFHKDFTELVDRGDLAAYSGVICVGKKGDAHDQAPVTVFLVPLYAFLCFSANRSFVGKRDFGCGVLSFLMTLFS